MIGWSTKRLRELGVVITGTTPSTAREDFYGGEYKLISPADLDNGKYVSSAHRQLTKAGFDQCRALPKDAVLVGCIGNVGKLGMVNDDMSATNQQINALICNTASDPHFVYYSLRANVGRLQQAAVMTTVPLLNKSNFSEVEIEVPEVNEQRRIAHVLGTVQQAIEQQERLIRSTTELKQALMQKLFTEGLRGEAQKETEIGLVPESWEVVKLGSLSTVISKGSSPNWQGFQYQASGVLFVRSQNVGDGRMLLEDRVYLSEEFNQKEKRSILKQGDILINLVGASIGRVALGTSEVEGANCNQAVGFVRLKGAQAMKEFMVNFLLSPAGQEQIRQQKKDIARANLSLLDVRTFKVPMPSDAKELDEVARAFATIEGKLAHHATKHNALQDLFRTLLHELMTGKVRVGE